MGFVCGFDHLACGSKSVNCEEMVSCMAVKVKVFSPTALRRTLGTHLVEIAIVEENMEPFMVVFESFQQNFGRPG